MLSKRFFAWVGIGVIGVATIPALAGPGLSRLALRRPAETNTTSKVITPAKKPLPAKAGVVVKGMKTTTAAGKTTVTAARKTATIPAKKVVVKTAVAKPATKAKLLATAPAKKPATLAAHKTTTLAAHKPVATAKPLVKKSTNAAAAKKLLS